MDNDQLISNLRYHHRMRCFAMDSRKMLDLRCGSHLRMLLGWRKDKPEAERKRIATEASALMKMSEPDRFQNMIVGTRLAREPFDGMEDENKKAMAALIKPLPIWADFAKSVRGFGEVSLAVILAEAGDLSNYDGISKLWKRMGLAPGQNRVPPGLSKEDRSAAWIERGYSPRRRSHMFVIGETLLKAQIRKAKDADGNDTGERVALGPYGEALLHRKRHTQQTHPEWWCDKDGNPKVDKETGRPMSAHGNADAQRCVEKRLLRDLWRAWRRSKSVMEAARFPSHGASVAEIREAAE